MKCWHLSGTNVRKMTDNTCQYQCIYKIWYTIYQLVLKILNGNEISALLKGHTSDTNVRKITLVAIPISTLSVSMHIQNLEIIYQFVLKILSGN